MIAKDHDGIDRERSLLARHAEGMTQGGDVVDEEGGTSIRDGDREEERPTGNAASPIAHHARSLPRITRRSIRATALHDFPDNVQLAFCCDRRLLTAPRTAVSAVAPIG